MKREISYNEEIMRKGVHLVSLSIPIIYSFVSKQFALTGLIIVALLFIIPDILSKYSDFIKKLIMKFFGRIMRDHEIGGKFVLNGASWVLISAILCIYIFPKIIFLAAFSILIVSDTAAALIGKKFGKHKLFNKSIEGTTAFIVSAFLVILVIGIIYHAPWTFYFFGLIASIFGGIIEAASSIIKLDDNFSIPLSVGLSLWAFEYLSLSLFGLSYLFLVN